MQSLVEILQRILIKLIQDLEVISKRWKNVLIAIELQKNIIDILKEYGSGESCLNLELGISSTEEL